VQLFALATTKVTFYILKQLLQETVSAARGAGGTAFSPLRPWSALQTPMR